MKIDIILPFKEIFSKNKASSVSITVKNSIEFSKFKNDIHVFGQFVKNSIEGIKFTGIKTNRFIHFGNNRSILSNYLKLSRKEVGRKKIIEMHNRPYLFNSAISKNINVPITLHFHNDPREMKGSKTLAERDFIAKNAAAVYFVSNYIKNCFLEGLKNNYTNLFVLPNAIQRTILDKPHKKKKVLFIGRLVPEKGCHLFVEAIESIAKDYQQWEFTIIGTPKAGQNNLNISYAKRLISKFKSIGNNIEYLGFLPNDEVQNILKETSILVVPSIWPEPCGLTALEGICNGAAVIASNVGGLGEILKDTGYLIDSINKDKLEHAIKSLLLDKDSLSEYQNKSWLKYRYNQTDIVKIQDKHREEIIKNLY